MLVPVSTRTRPFQKEPIRPVPVGRMALLFLMNRRGGVPVHGLCLYPILNYPGWDDDRHCQSGLWGYPGPAGEREIHLPLAEELARQAARFRSEPESVASRDQDPDARREPGEKERENAAF